MKTALFSRHLSLGARIVSFAGWEMPLHYSQGIIQEHITVRNSAGLFDVSHMGRIAIKGLEAETFLDRLTSNSLQGKANFSTTYTILMNEAGGAVDDLLAYKVNSAHYFVVANASNRTKVLQHLQRMAQNLRLTIEACFENESIFALQGPQATTIAKSLFPSLSYLSPHHLLQLPYLGQPIIIAQTGYTGSGGYEFFGPTAPLLAIWDALIDEGAQPVGLGARDTLRLEMGYALYGHELTETIAPLESVAAWAVKMNKAEFLGKIALERLQNSPQKRHAYGVRLLDKGIAREGYDVEIEEKKIGYVTSGTYSPSLQQAIALILVQPILTLGGVVDIVIRGHKCRAELVPLPFFKP